MRNKKIAAVGGGYPAAAEQRSKLWLLLLYQEVLKMSNEIQAKVLRALELALLINPESTQRERTGNKPSVFVWFSGHCGSIHIDIYPIGWYFEVTDDGNRESYDAYIDSAYEADRVQLDKALARLEEIWAEVQRGKIQ